MRGLGTAFCILGIALGLGIALAILGILALLGMRIGILVPRAALLWGMRPRGIAAPRAIAALRAAAKRLAWACPLAAPANLRRPEPIPCLGVCLYFSRGKIKSRSQSNKEKKPSKIPIKNHNNNGTWVI